MSHRYLLDMTKGQTRTDEDCFRRTRRRATRLGAWEIAHILGGSGVPHPAGLELKVSSSTQLQVQSLPGHPDPIRRAVVRI
jgi:hypothetical protein